MRTKKNRNYKKKTTKKRGGMMKRILSKTNRISEEVGANLGSMIYNAKNFRPKLPHLPKFSKKTKTSKKTTSSAEAERKHIAGLNREQSAMYYSRRSVLKEGGPGPHKYGNYGLRQETDAYKEKHGAKSAPR
jgi:hypothetical protein